MGSKGLPREPQETQEGSQEEPKELQNPQQKDQKLSPKINKFLINFGQIFGIKNAQKIRVGGMVKEDSIKMDQNTVNFVITDFKNEINVTYSGAIPNLFAEGKGVVAECFLNDRNYLKAKKILVSQNPSQHFLIMYFIERQTQTFKTIIFHCYYLIFYIFGNRSLSQTTN